MERELNLSNMSSVEEAEVEVSGGDAEGSGNRCIALFGWGWSYCPKEKEFKYLWVSGFTSEGKMEHEMDRRIDAPSAVYRSVVVKKVGSTF